MWGHWAKGPAWDERRSADDLGSSLVTLSGSTRWRMNLRWRDREIVDQQQYAVKVLTASPSGDQDLVGVHWALLGDPQSEERGERVAASSKRKPLHRMVDEVGKGRDASKPVVAN